MLAVTMRRDEGGQPGEGVDARVAAAARGDRAAAEELLREIMPRVRNLVRYLVRGDGDVDDLAQEGLIAILRGLGSYRGEGTLRAWADRVVVHVVVDAMRKRRSGSGRTLFHAPDVVDLSDDRDRADRFLVRRQVVRLLDELPIEQRQALVLHHALGLTVGEVAAEFSIPPETVRSRLRLGKARLRGMWLDAERDETEGG